MDEGTDEASLMMVERVDELANDSISVTLTKYVLEGVDDESTRKKIEREGLYRLYRLGLLSHNSGLKPRPEAWDDPSEFKLDQQRFDGLVREALGPSLKLRSVFEAVRTLVGLRSGFIRHKTLSDQQFLLKNFTIQIDLKRLASTKNSCLQKS